MVFSPTEVARSAICVSVTGEPHGGDRVGHVGGKALHVDREILACRHRSGFQSASGSVPGLTQRQTRSLYCATFSDVFVLAHTEVGPPLTQCLPRRDDLRGVGVRATCQRRTGKHLELTLKATRFTHTLRVAVSV
jgi:hypothetical protein